VGVDVYEVQEVQRAPVIQLWLVLLVLQLAEVFARNHSVHTVSPPSIQAAIASRLLQDQICLTKKSLDSPNSPQNSNSEDLFQCSTNNLVKWTNLVSADFSFKFSVFSFTSTSGAFLCTFLFRKEPFKHLVFTMNPPHSPQE